MIQMKAATESIITSTNKHKRQKNKKQTCSSRQTEKQKKNKKKHQPFYKLELIPININHHII